MNRLIGLGLLLGVLAAAVFAFRPRPPPAFPATGVAADRLLLLDVTAAGTRQIVVGERGKILVSDDAGKTWRVAVSPATAMLTAVRFVDERRGYAVGHDAVIVRSDDAGATWSQQHAAPDEKRPLLAVWFDDARRGAAVGAYGAYFETDDGGAHWRSRSILPGDRHLNAIAGGTDGIWFIAGEAGLLARSDDAGRTWRELASPYPGSYFGVLRLADGGVLVWGLRGHVFRSADRGETWQAVAAGLSTATLLGGIPVTDGGVMLVGREGVVLASRDSGRSFAASRRPDGKALAAVQPLAGAELLLVGEGGVSRAEVPR